MLTLYVVWETGWINFIALVALLKNFQSFKFNLCPDVTPDEKHAQFNWPIHIIEQDKKVQSNTPGCFSWNIFTIFYVYVAIIWKAFTIFHVYVISYAPRLSNFICKNNSSWCYWGMQYFHTNKVDVSSVSCATLLSNPCHV